MKSRLKTDIALIVSAAGAVIAAGSAVAAALDSDGGPTAALLALLAAVSGALMAAAPAALMISQFRQERDDMRAEARGWSQIAASRAAELRRVEQRLEQWDNRLAQRQGGAP